ncbi:MAG: hypothetical protein ABI333_26400 [bacterium]
MFDLLDWRHVYDVWTEKPDPPDPFELARELPEWAQDLRLINRHATEPWWMLWLVDDTDTPLVQIEHTQSRWDASPGGVDGEPEDGLEQLLESAHSHYVLSVRGEHRTSVHGVQLALALSHSLLSLRNGVLHDLSALRMLTRSNLNRLLASDDFAIEDHVTLHLVTDEASHEAWLHSHGMEKFGRSNLETFDLQVTLGRDAGKLLNELMLSSALGSRNLLGEEFELPGGAITIRTSNELRPGVLSIPAEEFEGHEGPYLCLVDRDTFGNISRHVDGYLHRSLIGISDAGEEEEVTRHLLPLVRSHFSENNTSEDYEYYARIPLDVKTGNRTAQESVWVRITRWRDNGLRGILASDSVIDSRMQVGTEVEFDTEDIEAIMLSVSGEPVGGKHLKHILEENLGRR